MQSSGPIDVSLLRRRLSIIESIVRGGQALDREQSDLPSESTLSGGLGACRAVQLLEGRLDQLFARYPDVKACELLLQDLTPMLLGKGFGLQGLAASLSDILAKQESIIKATENLAEIKLLSSSIDVFVDDVAMSRLLVLESDIEGMKRGLELQTQEIMDILDQYDTAMNALSDISKKWDSL